MTTQFPARLFDRVRAEGQHLAQAVVLAGEFLLHIAVQPQNNALVEGSEGKPIENNTGMPAVGDPINRCDLGLQAHFVGPAEDLDGGNELDGGAYLERQFLVRTDARTTDTEIHDCHVVNFGDREPRAEADQGAWQLANQLLFNAVPLLVAAKYSGTSDTTLANEAAAVLSAVGLTRLGILMMVQLQAPLLPKLTAAAAHRRFAEVRQYTKRLSLLCAAVGLAGSLGCWVLGPWVLSTIMRAHAHLPGDYLAVLALGTAFVMVGYILQAALVAMDRHVVVLTAWAVGAVVTVPVFFAGQGLLRTTAIAGVVGPFVAMLIMAAEAWLRTRGGDQEPVDGDLRTPAPALR